MPATKLLILTINENSRCNRIGCFREVPPGFEPGNKGFADLRLTTWLWHRNKNGAVDGTRTRDIHLGKVALYQLSYYRIKPVPWGGIEPPTL